MNLGNAGDSNTLIWLYCDLCNYGRTSIKQGWRKGLPQNQKPIWVICPLLRGQFPRDRQLIENCKKCTHYKSVSHSVLRTAKQQHTTQQSYHIQKPEQPRKPKKTITTEQMEQAVKEKHEQDLKWLEQEKQFQKE